MNRIPRKIKKKIPEGLYCYKGIKMDMETGVYHIKSCKFYTHIMLKDVPEEQKREWHKEYPDAVIGWCKFLTCEIDDQCKSCGINEGKY